MPNTQNTVIGYHEMECKLDAPDDATLKRIQTWVLDTPKTFAPSTHAKFLSDIPREMHGLFRAPTETTEIRVRVYWDTEDLDAVANDLEIRQEVRGKGRGIRQTIKEGGNADGKDPVLDRMEYVARIKKFGPDFDAVEDDDAKKRFKRIFKGKDLKPVICMISQRTRIKYHPDGNPDIEIEIGLDYPCWGFTFDGLVWQAPQLELELVKGPKGHREGGELLQREAARFEDRFKLVRNVTSKPTPGFDHLAVVLPEEAGKKAFKALRATKPWWAGMRNDFQMMNIAQRLKAG